MDKDKESKGKKGLLKWTFSNAYFYLILFLWLLYSFKSSDYELSIENLFYNLIVMIPFTFIGFSGIYLALKFKDTKDFPIKSWKWIIYIIGWFTGCLVPIFWLIQYIAYLSKDYGDKFLTAKFCIITYRWGWFMIIAWLLIGAFIILL